MSSKKIYPVWGTPPRLVKSAKRWYIDYKIWDVIKNKFIRRRHFKNLEDRNIIQAEGIRTRLQMALENGWVIQPEQAEVVTLHNAVLEVYDYKVKTITSPGGFKTLKNVFLPWATKKGLANKALADITKKNILLFLDYVRLERQVGEKTYNHYVTDLGTVFEHYVEREIIPTNPTKKIKKLRVKASTHLPFTAEQRTAIAHQCQQDGYLQLLLFVQFMYYSFGRPSELMRLRVGHIKKDSILFKGTETKTAKTDYVRIPPPLERLIVENGLRDFPKDYYIFGQGGFPNQEPAKVKTLYKQHRRMLDRIGLTARRKYTMYGHKHSGVVALFSVLTDYSQMQVIQAQCRHASMDMTFKYLRDLGLIFSAKGDILKKIPIF